MSHLLYVDGLKLIGKTEDELQIKMQTTTLAIICTQNLDLTDVQKLYGRKEN
jgi:hypothetical protein